MYLFLNYSNHPLINWSEKHIDGCMEFTAKKAGVSKEECYMEDMPFLKVDPFASPEEIKQQAAECVDKILAKNPTVVLVQGEHGATYQIVRMLLQKGICTVHSTSERKTVETVLENGTSSKTSVFEYCQIREYIN